MFTFLLNNCEDLAFSLQGISLLVKIHLLLTKKFCKMLDFLVKNKILPIKKDTQEFCPFLSIHILNQY